MHTEIECKTPAGEVSKQTFKFDTGADGNLMTITVFTKLFPRISLKTFEKTVENGVNLYTYNNTPIRIWCLQCFIELLRENQEFVNFM